jgi:hypothetical protein
MTGSVQTCFRQFIALVGILTAISTAGIAETATGVVFQDRDGDGQRNPSERGISGIRVSNGRDIVITDASGRWSLPVLEGSETDFFVIKPKGWMVPLDSRKLPRFAYIHKPTGSPTLKYPGLKPTGDLPKSIDFPLVKQDEPETFQAIFFGDTQPRDLREVEYIAHDTVEELIGHPAKFGVTLGDIVFDDLSVMEPLAGTIAMIGLPWWNVIGNHDVNADATDAQAYNDTYNRIYGPSYFSFDYGPVHFIALDNIRWTPPGDRGTNRATWKPALDGQQLEWLQRDLSFVKRETLVLLMMHVPIDDMLNRKEVYRLIESRPYCLSIAGHTHYQEHRFLKRDDGWMGSKPHHHIVNVTVCGSWFTGQPDEWGIPHATMADGAPNGYTVLTFKDRNVTVDYKASRRPMDYQMSLYAPESIAATMASSTNLYVNVFNGSDSSRVEFRVDESTPWIALKKTLEPDPYYLAARAREPEKPALPWRALGAPMKSPHLWKATLPDGLAPGVRTIRVRATDVHGRWHTAERVITIQ